MISRSEVSPPDVIAHIQSVLVAVGGAALLQLFVCTHLSECCTSGSFSAELEVTLLLSRQLQSLFQLHVVFL